MELSATLATSPPLTDGQRAALINLLGDEDTHVYQAVREKILSCGPLANAWLRPHVLSSDPVLRRRAIEIIQHFHRQSADNVFLGFCLNNGEDFDVEEGAWLLAQTQYPQINLEAYKALLDNYAGELRERIAGDTTARQILGTINNYIFDDLGFHGNEENYYDPENSYLNRILDRRTGDPINLCLLYILLGRRLKLPMTGIGLPGHFLCRYQSSASEIYVDAFNHGRLLAKADCVRYLLRGNYSLNEDYLTPISARRMLTRICGNLHQIYLHLELTEETTKFQRYLVALER
jgi:regulator of sirC expression with transglutaminase-like and TPR domain